MELLVAFDDDPAGSRMAARLAKGMEEDGGAAAGGRHGGGGSGSGSGADDQISGVWRSRHYDMITISTPAISADWLEEAEIVSAGGYDGYVFLSRHSAESGELALTCHSTGNFGPAKFGGNDSEVAVPHPHLQKEYMRNLRRQKDAGAAEFGRFDITIEATHHGPSALSKPALFVEIGTTPEQWNDDDLCGAVADVVHQTISSDVPDDSPVAICFGGTHYPRRFTDEILTGACALGTVVPKRAVPQVEGALLKHIVRRNDTATRALLDWGGMPGSDRKRLEADLEDAGLEVTRV